MEITPGIYSISQRQGIYVHAFLIDIGSELILIDTLYETGASHILAEIKRIGKSIGDLKHIVLTHAHRAHLGGLAALQSASRAKVHCHAWEADIVEGDRKSQCMSLGFMPPYRLWPFQLASRFGSHPPCHIDNILEDGDMIGPLQTVYSPGHTPGHLTFYIPEKRALFAGDALVNYPKFGPGWPAFALNQKQNLESMHKMAGLEIDVLGVGHGDPIVKNAGDRLHSLLDRLNA